MNSPRLRFNQFQDPMPIIPLNEVAAIFDGTHATPKYVEHGVPFYSVEQVTANNFKKTKFISEEVFEKECKRVVLERGDVLMTRIGDIGTTRLIDWDVRASFYVSLALIKPQNNVLGAYIAQYIKSSFFQRELFKRMIHVAFPKKINLGEIGKCHIAAPQVKEQQKVADFLSSVDKKISLLKEKHVLVTQYKKGVMQKLFKQEIRFKDDSGNDFPKWKERKFNDFISARKDYPSDTDDSALASLTIENGIEAKSARYVRDFLVNDEGEAYKLVFPNDFVSNPMNLRFGAIAKNNDLKKVKISKYYDVFFVDETVDKDYFALYLKSHEMLKTYHQTATGTLEEKKRVHFSEFIEFVKFFPCINEQKKIAQFILKFDEKIDLLEQQIELTQTFKKGLLQQMFV